MAISDHQWQYLGRWYYAGYYNNDHNRWLSINYSWRYPDNNTNSDQHYNGIIFASALMKIRENIVAQTNSTIGRNIADKLFLEMHFRWSSSTNFYNAANAYLESAKYLENGVYYCLVFNTLNSFGLISNTPAPQTMTGTYSSNTSIIGYDVNIQNVTVSSGATVKINVCNKIVINGLTVNAGGTLELEAGGKVSIDYGNFKIMEGASFKIK